MNILFLKISYIYFTCMSFCPHVCVCYWYLKKSEENLRSPELEL